MVSYRRLCLTVLALLTPEVLGAQVRDAGVQWIPACRFDGGRAIRGTVRDSGGLPLKDVTIFLPVWQPRCGAVTDSVGRYVISSGPPEAVVLEANLIGYDRVRIRVPADTSTTTQDFALTRIPTRVRDWRELSSRPPSLKDASGILGCYWMGYPFVADSSRTFEVLRDGVVKVPGDQWPDATWQRQGDRLEVTLYRGMGHKTLIIDLSEPVEWEAVPALFLYKTDVIRIPSEFEAFVTRVPCGAGGVGG